LLQKNLKYAGEVQLLVGDDSLSEEEGFHLFDFKGDKQIEGLLLGPHELSVTGNPAQFGLGKNLNSLLARCQAAAIDYVIQQDDDHWLVKELDITPHVKKLMEDDTAGAIRLMGVGGHRYRATLDGRYWRIDWESAEVYIASNRPHLKKISRFHGQYGMYPEGFKLGLTEEKFCHICIDTAKLNLLHGQPTVDVLVPLDTLTESGWEHSEQHGGISWQAKGF
jgi:hypothetical protein